MIGKKDILKITRTVMKRSGGIPDRRSIHPSRDWFIGLTIATFCFAIAALYAGYDFVTKYRNVDVMPMAPNTVVSYKQEDAQKILETFAERARVFQLLREDAQASYSHEEIDAGEEVLEILAEDTVPQ